jgi:hypothetical protein
MCREVDGVRERVGRPNEGCKSDPCYSHAYGGMERPRATEAVLFRLSLLHPGVLRGELVRSVEFIVSFNRPGCWPNQPLSTHSR